MLKHKSKVQGVYDYQVDPSTPGFEGRFGKKPTIQRASFDIDLNTTIVRESKIAMSKINQESLIKKQQYSSLQYPDLQSFSLPNFKKIQQPKSEAQSKIKISMSGNSYGADSQIYSSSSKFTIQLKVRQQSGSLYKVKIPPTETVLAVKEKLSQRFDIATPSKQLLEFQDTILQNDKHLKHYNIEEGSILKLFLSKTIEVIIEDNVNQKKYMCTIQQLSTIAQLKEEINKQSMIEPIKQILKYNGKQLESNKLVKDYNLDHCNITLTKKLGGNNLKILNKVKKYKIIFDNNKQIKPKLYLKTHKNMTIKQFIFQQTQQSEGQYCILYNNVIHSPNKILQQLKIEDSQDLISVFYAIKPQGLLYYINLQELDVNQIDTSLEQYYNEKDMKILSQYKINYLLKKEKFPKSYYSQQNFYKVILQLVSGVYKNLDNVFLDQKISIKDIFAKKLITNLSRIKNKIGYVYSISHNFKFSSLNLRQGETIYFKDDFFSAVINEQFAKNNLVLSNKGTIYKIYSLRGKNIKIFNMDEIQQIIFLPNTYFYIDRIFSNSSYDEVHLTQIPSPTRFGKDSNLIIWVDDEPENNVKEIQALKLQFKDKYQVLQLTSTQIADQWMHLFGWLLKSTGIDFKVITDMKRYQGLQQRQNQSAGVDLLWKIKNQYGYDTDILIYCNYVEGAMKQAIERKIPKQQIKICRTRQEVIKFIEGKL